MSFERDGLVDGRIFEFPASTTLSNDLHRWRCVIRFVVVHFHCVLLCTLVVLLISLGVIFIHYFRYSLAFFFFIYSFWLCASAHIDGTCKWKMRELRPAMLWMALVKVLHVSKRRLQYFDTRLFYFSIYGIVVVFHFHVGELFQLVFFVC